METCLQAKKKTQDKALQEKLGKLAIDALERAETIKVGEKKEETPVQRNIVKPLGELNLHDGIFNYEYYMFDYHIISLC